MSKHYGKHVMTFLIHFLLLFGNVKFSKEIERDNGVDVNHDGEEHDG